MPFLILVLIGVKCKRMHSKLMTKFLQKKNKSLPLPPQPLSVFEYLMVLLRRIPVAQE